MPCSQVCHIGLTVFLFLLLAQKGLEVHGRKLRRESFEKLNTESEEDVAPPVYYQGVDGQPGVDFPTLSYIPRTSFSCAEMESGYYADTETGCQVFHICNNGVKVSFLCPNGTIFQQSELICEWWFKVNCSIAPSLYQDSAEQFQLDTIRRKESRRVTGTSTASGATQTQRSSTAQSKETFRHHPTSSSLRRNNFNTSPKPSSNDHFQENQGSTTRGPTVYKSNSKQNSNIAKNRKNNSDEPSTSSLQHNRFQSTSRIPVSVSHEETQIPEESGSFVRSRFNSISSSLKSTTENPYPNHRKSYSDIKDPKVYGKSYSKLPEKSFYGTSLGPETLSTIPVLPHDSAVTQSPSTIANQPPEDDLQKTTLIKDDGKTIDRGSTSNDPDTTSSSQYDVPSGFTVEGVAVVTTENQQKIANQEDIQINTSQISTTENKLIYLKTATESSRSFETHAQRNGKSDKSPRGTEAPSLDFNVNSISVIPFRTQSKSTTERSYYQSTTLNPSTTTSESKISGTLVPDNLGTTHEDSSSTLSPSDSTSKLNPEATGSSRIGFDYFGTTESSQQQNTINPNKFARELNGIVYTTEFPRGFTLSSETAVNSDVSTIESRINIPNNKLHSNEDDNIHDITVSTVPTPYSTTTNDPSSEVTDDSMKNIINSLIRIAEERLNKDEEARFATNRPDLVVPPSVSPSTLHSLALYFANAADTNHLHPEDDFMNLNLTASEERSVVDMLLTEATRVGYESLFKDQTRSPAVEGSTKESPTTTVSSSTLDDEDPEYPPRNTSVRELARLFTSALSSYLDDPENFRKTLQGVRPTEPPVEGRTETNPEDEEVLNFSDSDHSVKSPPGNSQSTTTESTVGSTIPTTTKEASRDSSTSNTNVMTSEKPEPTLGFVIAYDTNSDSDNSIDQNGENLQTADSQSFVSQNANSLVVEKEYEQKSTLFDKGATTTISSSEKSDPPVTFRPRPTVNFIVAYGETKTPITTDSSIGSSTTGRTRTTSFDQEDLRSTSFWTTKDDLPNNHWTTSSDVTKLLQSALALDPLTVNFLTTSGISGTTESVTAGDEAVETSTKSFLENAESLYADVTGDNGRLNNVLMDIMKNTTNERERVRLILDKLNLTEDEFRNRMKEIESNPLAKRLVLLLVNRCNNNKDENGNDGDDSTNEIGSTTEQITETDKTTTDGDKNSRNPQRGVSNVFRKFVDKNLTDENEDTRALQLLNSLYVIASKFNK